MAPSPTTTLLYILRESGRTTVTDSAPPLPDVRCSYSGWDGVSIFSTQVSGADSDGMLGAFAPFFALVTFFLTGVATTVWIGLLAGAAAALLLVGIGALRRGAYRRPERICVLVGQGEREDFERVLELGERFSRTWTPLNGLLILADPRYAMTQVLWDVTDELARRERRAMHMKLIRGQLSNLIPGSAARQSVDNELRRTNGELRASHLILARQLAQLEATVSACEALVVEFAAQDREREALGRIKRSRQWIDESECGYVADGAATQKLKETTRCAIESYRKLLCEYGIA